MRRFSSAGQAALCVLLLGLTTVPVPPGAASSPPAGDVRDTGERFFTPLEHRELRVLVDGATGRKSLEDSAGRRWPSVEDAVREEEQALPPVRRTVHPGLWPLLDDPARAGEPVRVVLVLRSQPIRDASLLLREKAAPAIRQRIARIRAVLNGIAPLRAEDPERLLQLGHRMEEEARLLGPDAREELRRLRAETQSLLRDLRGEILADAREGCDLAQAPVLERLARIPDARVLARIRVLNAVVAEVPAGSLAALAESLPGLARILPHGVRRPGLNTSVATLGATTWSGAGYDGSSTTKVAIMDTGIDANHPAFFAGGNSIISNSAVFLAVGSQDPSFQDNASSTNDIFGHGSHVGGIVMSQDSTYKGVAPGGALMNAKCGYNSALGGNLQDGDIMSAGDWAADNGADAVNASFGGDDVTDGSSGLSLFFDALVDGLGIAAAVAAGNSGPGSGTVGVPGDAFNVLTVGSIADANTTTRSDDAISSFSSRGPLDDGRRKPDLAAPGSSITSCNYQWEGGSADFVAYDGTSMATPHIAGTCAVLLDYAASWRPEGLKALLLTTARNTTTNPSPALPNNNLGWGAADLSAAYASRATIKEGTLTSSGRDFAFVRMPNLASGKRATLCWNRDVAWNNASAPVTNRAAVDLDLYVYEESDGSLKGSSISGINTVEQVALSSTSTFPLLKIKRAGGFPSGQSSVSFAVASESTGTVPPDPAPPSLQCALDAGPALVKPGDTFTVTATLTVNGDLPAFAPTVTLTLPDGYSLVSGTDTVILQGIAAGGSRAASWSVTAGGLTGEKTLSATGSANSYGETFTSPAGTDDQILDATGPTGAVVVQGGAVAVPSSSVSVAVYAADDRTGVDSMRVRNALASWGDWQPFLSTFPWTLASGEGLRTVDVQVRDGAGNESGVLSGSIFVDPTAPSGSFVLSGGVSYLLPWESLTADTTSDDGAYGSGVKAVHVRWIKGGVPSAWTAWTPLDGDPVVPLARPAVAHDVRAEAQFRDEAGNVSVSAFDGIYLVEPDPPSLTAAKSFSGAMAPGGDVDAFVLGAASGDLVTVKIKSKPVRKGADFRVDADLVDPAGGRVVAGRYPVDAKKAGIAKFPIAITGDHWILIRAGGADAAEGGTYVLEVKRSVAKGNRGLGTGGDPVGGFVEIPFPGVAGSIVTGSIRGLFTGDPDVRRPDDSMGAVVTLPGPGGSRKIPGLVLTGGSGTYVLRIPAAGPVAVDLKFKAPQRLKLIEGAE